MFHSNPVLTSYVSGLNLEHIYYEEENKQGISLVKFKNNTLTSGYFKYCFI